MSDNPIINRLSNCTPSERLAWFREKAKNFAVICAYRSGMAESKENFLAKAVASGKFDAVPVLAEASMAKQGLIDVAHRFIRSAEMATWVLNGKHDGNSVPAALEMMIQSSGMVLDPDYIDSAMEIATPEVEAILEGEPSEFCLNTGKLCGIAQRLGILDGMLKLAPDEPDENTLASLEKIKAERQEVLDALAKEGW